MGRQAKRGRRRARVVLLLSGGLVMVAAKETPVLWVRQLKNFRMVKNQINVCCLTASGANPANTKA